MAKRQDDDSYYTPSNRGADAWAAGAELGQRAAERSQAKSALRKTQKAAQPQNAAYQLGKSGVAGAPTISDLGKTLFASPSGFKRGGRVKRTGLALVHRGEYVIPAGRTKIVASQVRERLSPAKHGKRKQVTKIVGSPVGKR